MKTLLTLTALAALALPAVASAQTPVTGNVTIGGAVGIRCSFVTGSANIPLGELADPGTGEYNNAANNTSATLNGWCNGLSSTMSVLATPIVRVGGGSASGAFVDVINYTATASVTPNGAGAPVVATDVSTDALAGAATVVSLFSGDITVGLSASGTAAGKLVAGTYAGNVAVTLTPAL